MGEAPNVSKVRGFYAAWNGADRDGVVSRFAEDAEFRPVFGPLHSVSEYRGHEGIAEWFREFHVEDNDFRFEPKEVVEPDDTHVVAIIEVIGRLRDGEEFCARAAHVFTMRDGKVTFLEARDADDTADELRAGDWSPPVR